MKPSLFLSTVVCGLLAVPAVASAQDQTWLRDRRYTEGPGYRVGDFEIHPGAAAEFGFDSNYLHRSGAENSSPIPSLRLRVTPSLSLSTLGPQRRGEGEGNSAPPPSVELKLAASATYNEFFGLKGGTDTGSGLSPAAVMSAQRNVGAALDLGLVFFPRRSWSGTLNLGYMRVITPTVVAVDVDQLGGTTTASQYAFNRDLPRGNAELVWTPGAGLFEWRLGYAFAGTIFENPAFSQLTNLNNSVTTRGRWRFLPRTALTYDAAFGFITYPSATTGDGAKLSSHPMRARLGINGLVTPSFSVTAMAGWGASFYTGGTSTAATQNFDSVIGQAELKWFLTPNTSTDPNVVSPTLSSISVGFLRDFYDSYIGNYYERDRGYLAFNFFYGGKFLMVIDGGAGPVIYPDGYLSTGSSFKSFTDLRIDASLFAEYRLKDSLGLSASVRYNQNIFNLGKAEVTSVGGNPMNLAFNQIEAYIGFRWLM